MKQHNSTIKAIEIAKVFGFEADSTYINGNHVHMSRKFETDKLYLTISGYNSTASVNIYGIGIKSSRSPTYYFDEDAKKLSNRIKRIVKLADKVDKNKIAVEKANIDIFETIKSKIDKLDMGFKVERYWGGKRASITVNGYELIVDENLTVQMKTFQTSQKVDMLTAIKIALLLPKYEEEE